MGSENLFNHYIFEFAHVGHLHRGLPRFLVSHHLTDELVHFPEPFLQLLPEWFSCVAVALLTATAAAAAPAATNDSNGGGNEQ